MSARRFAPPRDHTREGTYEPSASRPETPSAPIGPGRDVTDADRMETLRSFGLGPYASRAYLALLEIGPADARAISRESRIPPAKVYGTLNQLMERGLVRLLVDQPRRYEPVPFAEFLDQQRAGHIEEAQRLSRVAPTLAPLFQLAFKNAASDRGGVAVLRGRQPILRLHRQLASRVHDELLMVPSAGTSRRASAFAALLADPAARGVRPRVMIPVGSSADIVDSIRPFAEIRFIPPPVNLVDTVTTACFDSRQIVLTHHVPDDGSVQDGHDVAIHISEEAIARVLHEGLTARWNAALPNGTAGKRPPRRK